MKKQTIIWIVVGVLLLVGIILIWRAMAKAKQDREDEEERLADEADTGMADSKKACRKFCRKMCKEKYRGKRRRQCKRDCKDDCFSNLRVVETKNY